MKVVVDRVVQYANRYKLTNAETGEVLGTYDFEEVTGTVQEEGTEINKELFDSIQADLNNKLDKVTTPHVTRRAYIVDADGVTQGVLDIQVADIGNTLVMRGQDGSVLVSTITEANDGRSATPKSYVDGKYNDTVHISEQTLSEAEQEQALENLNVPNMYAKQNGTYSNLHAGYASMDGNGNTITEFYATKTELSEEAATRAAADTALGGRIDDIVDGTTTVAKATDADSATKATQDGNGHVITDTYATKAVATQTSDGLMSAEDKVALDTLADTVDFDTIVRYTEQTGITEEQQTQAQENIGLPAQSAISRYNLGAFDSYVDNGDGTATITRRTGYYKVDVAAFVVEPRHFYQQVGTLPNGDTSGYSNMSDYNPNATSNVYKLGVYSENNSFYVAVDGWLRVSDNNYSYDDDGLAQFKNAVESKGGMFIQYETTTSYTEDVISARPINTLDQQAMWSVREEWERGLNVFDDSSIRGYTLTTSSGFLIPENTPFTIEAGTYTTCVCVSGGQKVNNTFLILLTGDDVEISLIGSVANASNTYCTVTITAEQASKINKITMYYNAQLGELSGQELIGVMMVKGSAPYPYQPYHGGILRPTDATDIAANAASATRLSRTYEVDNPSGLDGAWVSVGYVTMGTAAAYSNYSIIFLLNGLFNSQGIDNPARSGQLELDVRQDLTNYTPTLSVLSGNIETNRFCCMREGHIIWLYMYCTSQYSRTRYVVLNEAVPNYDTGNFETFTFDSTHQSTSAPSGAVYAVNRNTSSLEANGGTVNGDINVTGTVSEQGQRVYSPNNPPPAAVLYQHTITLSKRMSENGSICYITFAILSKKTGFLGYGLDIIFSLIEETCIFPASGNYPGDTVVNQMCGIVHSVTAVKAGSYLQINYIKYDPTTANAQFPDEYTVNITDDDGFSVTDQVMQIC